MKSPIYTTPPAFTYPGPLPGAGMQAASSADRPWCAIAAGIAAAGRVRGFPNPPTHPLRGALFGSTTDEAYKVLDAAADATGIPYNFWNLWSDALSGRKCLTQVRATPINGATASDYQLQAVAGMSLAGGVLALGCGLGKTLTALWCLERWLDDRLPYLGSLQLEPLNIWVVCPLNAVGTWKRILPHFDAAMKQRTPTPVYWNVVSMDSLHKIAPGLRPDSGAAVIFDEAHNLGEPTARRTLAAHEFRSKFGYGLCLTGTLLHGGVHKALSILDLAVPGLAGFSNRWKAGEAFRCLVRKNIGSRTVTALERPSGANKTAFLDYLAQRRVVAMTTDSPEVRSQFALPEQHIYRIRISEPWADLTTSAVEIVQAAINAGEPDVMSASEVAHRLTAAGAQAKIDWLLDNLEDEPVVVFAQYTATLDAAEAALKAAGIGYVRVDGSVTGDARTDAQQAFQSGKVQIFLGQMTAASVAMDLFRARMSVCLDHSWKATDYAQALARTARRGQTVETHHFDLVANALQDRIVDKVQAGDEFNAQVAEWQDLKRATKTST